MKLYKKFYVLVLIIIVSFIILACSEKRNYYDQTGYNYEEDMRAEESEECEYNDYQSNVDQDSLKYYEDFY